ncbi:MAG: glycosyltransferase family 2 protein [Phycisphaerales bacterium]|nr:glycosyltransferase family 2 protein [Phycisphaerales bacterium]
MRGPRTLLGIPVFNEAASVDAVLTEVLGYTSEVLVIDDGSTDATPRLLASHPVEVIRHANNRGYGRSMQDMLRWAAVDGYDWLITMDCDRQHEPASIPAFTRAILDDDADVISGSRYLAECADQDAPPPDRREINSELTALLNERLNLCITDAFCGFKAYRVQNCAELRLDVDGYDFPMQFWAEAYCAGLRIRELPVRLIYTDQSRSFGGPLDDPVHRRQVYHATLEKALQRCQPEAPCCG